ncbi:hypothetical protein BH24ACT3_BH24ACT3_05790 [soil metagenome]
MTFAARDLTVVIPTVGRWHILRRTLAALERQSEVGFETIVVIDGADLEPPPLDAAPGPEQPGGEADRRGKISVVQRPQGGAGAARNTGMAATDRPLVLFLGDDMIPDAHLVERHLARHRAEPAAEVAVLGHVDWHPDVATNPLLQWMDWSGTQFDYQALQASSGDEAGFGRFYTSNVSLKRALFDAAGGFDEGFAAYEDIELGWQLDRLGMVLRYEPDAVVHHLHDYDWPAVVRRFQSVAVAERHMAEKHEWFEPFFRRRAVEALAAAPAARLWTRVADRVPDRMAPLGRVARSEADLWYRRRLAGPFLDAWEDDRAGAELRAYLGDRYDPDRLVHHRAEVEAEECAAPDEASFYRTSEAYLYDLTAFAMSGTKAPYLRDLRRLVAPGASLLDYGCGIGADGLRLLEDGYQVSFADFDNPSTRYLRWRLARRGLTAPVHDLDGHVPGGFDAAFCFDVIEHVDEPFALLGELEHRARLVVVNLLDPELDDTHLHRPLPVAAILDHAERRGLVHYRQYHGRSHLVAYRPAPTDRSARLRSRLQRRVGPSLGDRHPGTDARDVVRQARRLVRRMRS